MLYFDIEKWFYIILIFNVMYILYSYVNWITHFKQRFQRNNIKSPYHEKRPHLIGNKEVRQEKTKLDFDSNYLPFQYFLFASYFIIPNTWLQGIIGTISVLSLQLLRKIHKITGIGIYHR